MENTGDLILAIDNGTQSVRALLFDAQGNLHHKVRIELEPYVSPHPGWAEQDPQYYWNTLCQACRQLWQVSGVQPGALAAATITTQRATVVNVDREGHALRPAIVWLDQRRTQGLPPVGGLWGLAFRLVRMRETVAYFQAEAEANWLRTHQPDIWRKTHKFLFLSGYLTHRLTGRFVDSAAAQVGYVPFDYKHLRWASRRDWKWQAVPVDPGMLPDLVQPAELLGTVTPQAAGETGLPKGLPVYAAAADKACEVLGSGCLEPHMGCLSFGTTATINTTHHRYIEVIPLVPPFPAAVPRAYNLELQIYRGYWMVSWFKQQFGHRETRIAHERGIEPEMLFDELVNQVSPGSHGLILQPYWSPGVKVPGPEAKGAVIGFGDVHTRAHLYRAILEGLTYALREGKERTERRSRVPITALRVAGGGSQSNAAMQITANVFGLPASRPHTYEASGLGAAIAAAVGCGLHSDFATAVANMTRLRDTFDPDPQTHAIYDALYKKVYKKMYNRLQPLYEDIREITGYPSRPG